MAKSGVGQSGPAGETLETVVAQLCMAFGQGAGSLFVSPEAINAGRDQYLPLIKDNLSKWSHARVLALEYARTIGRVAAHLSIGDGRNEISKDDYTKAAKKVKDSSHRAICPF